MIVEEMIEMIKDYLLNENDNIKLIYIYGSFGSSNFNEQSDIDIALYDKELDFEQRMELSLGLEGLVGREVDIVNLVEVDINFAAEILFNGKNIYSIDQEFQEEYEMKVLAQYLTFEEDRRIVIEEIYKRGSIYAESSLK